MPPAAMNTARTMPSARPTRHAHTPTRTANLAIEMGTGRTAGCDAGDHTPKGPNKMKLDIRGMAQASRHAPTGGSHHETKYTTAARRNANGASNAVCREGTLRYSSPYPRSSRPEPTPVATPPYTQSICAGTPDKVEETTASVPEHNRAGTTQRTCGLLIHAQNSLARKAGRNIVRNRHTVEMPNTTSGIGLPFQVTQLAAAPMNMR